MVVLVDDVPAGEAFYRELFEMDVLFREGTRDGDQGTVPERMDWLDAIDAGIEPTMAFLGRDQFFLAVAIGDAGPSTGPVDHVALAVDDEDIDSVADRADDLGCDVDRNAPHQLFVGDRYGMEWELNAHPRPPSMAFDRFDR